MKGQKEVLFTRRNIIFSASSGVDEQSTAEVMGKLGLLETASVDKVCAVVKITNMSTGKVSYNRTKNMYYSAMQKGISKIKAVTYQQRVDIGWI